MSIYYLISRLFRSSYNSISKYYLNTQDDEGKYNDQYAVYLIEAIENNPALKKKFTDLVREASTKIERIEQHDKEIKMEIDELAAKAVSFLAYLFTRSAGRAAEELGDGLGEKLRALLSGNARTGEAVKDLGDDPDSADLHASLRVQIRKALREDDTLRVELAALIREAAEDRPSVFQKVTVTGKGHKVTVGGRDVKS